MKRLYILLCAALMLCAACDNKQTLEKKGSSGKTLEMLIVANKDVYRGDTKQMVDSLFRRPQVGLPQPEPMFDVVNIPISSFENTEMFRVHRNVVICDVKADNPDKVYIYRDKWAAPQVVFELAASSHASLDTMLTHYADRIVSEMYQADYRRIAKAFRGTKGYEQVAAIEKQYGFSLTVSNEFEIARPANESPDFAWIRKEAKDFGLGVLVHVSDYGDASVFDEARILDHLDTLMRQHIPGPSDSSYMGTERRAEIVSRVVQFNDCKYAVETRGCWRLFGDFMGGPFVCYTLLDPTGHQVITLTGYVYCPRFDKRDYLMQVDGICHSLTFAKK
ncbi:MAG: DUF4837 family protein [Bacteroidales bacterium]|nr:DUF4837 family protein [Bacteroidales bacterium]